MVIKKFRSSVDPLTSMWQKSVRFSEIRVAWNLHIEYFNFMYNIAVAQ